MADSTTVTEFSGTKPGSRRSSLDLDNNTVKFITSVNSQGTSREPSQVKSTIDFHDEINETNNNIEITNSNNNTANDSEQTNNINSNKASSDDQNPSFPPPPPPPPFSEVADEILGIHKTLVYAPGSNLPPPPPETPPASPITNTTTNEESPEIAATNTRKPNFAPPPNIAPPRAPNFPKPPPSVNSTGINSISSPIASSNSSNSSPSKPSGPRPPPPRGGSLNSTTTSNGTDHNRNSSGQLDPNTVLHYLKQAYSAADIRALTDLLDKADFLGLRDPLIDNAKVLLKEKQEEKLNNDLQSSKYYLKQAIEAKNYSSLQEVLSQAEPIAEKLYSNSTTRKLNSDFFALIDEAKVIINNLDKQSIEACHFYLKTGIQTKNRDLLKQALDKASHLDSKFLDQTLLQNAQTTVQRLDEIHLTQFYLINAIKAKDDGALEETINRAQKLGMSSTEFPQINEATQMLATIRAKNNKTKPKHKTSISTTGSGGLFGFGKKKKDKTNEFQLFNSNLQQAVIHNKPLLLPRIVIETIQYLQYKGLKEHGLFRIAGNKDLVEVIKAEYESESEVKHNDIHDASTILKQYLRLLTEPICTFQLYNKFIAAGNERNVEKRIVIVKELIKSLPSENQLLLEYLMRFLLLVTQNSEYNKMTADNLAVVFAPSLLRTKADVTMDAALTEMQPSIQIISTLITNCNQIFGETPSENCKTVQSTKLNQLSLPSSRNNSLGKKTA